MKNIITPCTPLYSQRNENISLETELLFGESVSILEKRKNWIYCRAHNDNYLGWIKAENIGPQIQNNYKISSLCSVVKAKADVKSKTLFTLPFGCKLKITDIEKHWARLEFIDYNDNTQTGFISKNHIICANKFEQDWLKTAKLFLNVPYKWGGRTFLGIDCSALIQLSLSMVGMFISRNTKQQVEEFETIKGRKKNFTKGDLIFWEGHVAICINTNQLLHANDFHMKSKIEKIDTAILRIKKKIISVSNVNDYKEKSNCIDI